MSFRNQHPLQRIEETANPGQLLTITDSSPMHKVGALYYNPDDDKTYIYAYNATGADAVQYSLEILENVYSAATPRVNWQAIGVSDSDGDMAYVCAPAAAIPTLYYGWWQVQGDVAAAAGLVSETRTAGEELIVTDTTYIAATAGTNGCEDAAFAIVNATTTAAATTANIYLLGREFPTGT